MVQLTRIYTRGGDKGRTSLGTGKRVAKHDRRVAAYGTVDEANAAIGLVRLHSEDDLDALLARIQNDLFDLGADLCTPEVENPERVRSLFVDTAHDVQRLSYFSDRPRKQAFPDDAPKKDITRELYDVLTSARHSVVIQSPYMVLSKRARRLFADLRIDHPEIELVFSTNSLASTDSQIAHSGYQRYRQPIL